MSKVKNTDSNITISIVDTENSFSGIYKSVSSVFEDISDDKMHITFETSNGSKIQLLIEKKVQTA